MSEETGDSRAVPRGFWPALDRLLAQTGWEREQYYQMPKTERRWKRTERRSGGTWSLLAVVENTKEPGYIATVVTGNWKPDGNGPYLRPMTMLARATWLAATARPPVAAKAILSDCPARLAAWERWWAWQAGPAAAILAGWSPGGDWSTAPDRHAYHDALYVRDRAPQRLALRLFADPEGDPRTLTLEATLGAPVAPIYYHPGGVAVKFQVQFDLLPGGDDPLRSALAATANWVVAADAWHPWSLGHYARDESGVWTSI